jgi:hypothetical protein
MRPNPIVKDKTVGQAIFQIKGQRLVRYPLKETVQPIYKTSGNENILFRLSVKHM